MRPIKESVSNTIDRTAKRLKALAGATACTGLSSVTAMTSYASGLTIDHNYKIAPGAATLDPEGLIIGLAVWICRLVGIAMLIWGIYGYVTARKDGEAESMNGAIGKLISGIVLVAMPTILRALNIIA